MGGSWGIPLLLKILEENFLNIFSTPLVQILDVLVGVVGECVARAPSPQELLCFLRRTDRRPRCQTLYVSVCGRLPLQNRRRRTVSSPSLLQTRRKNVFKLC